MMAIIMLWYAKCDGIYAPKMKYINFTVVIGGPHSDAWTEYFFV